MILCERYSHIFKIDLICLNKECNFRLFCKNCSHENIMCKNKSTIAQFVLLLDKNFTFFSKDFEEYQSLLGQLYIIKSMDEQFQLLISNVQREIQILGGIIELSYYLNNTMKQGYFDVDKIDQYFKSISGSGPLNQLKQFCKQYGQLSNLGRSNQEYELITQFINRETTNIQVFNFKHKNFKPLSHQNLNALVQRSKFSNKKFSPSVCQITTDEKKLIILERNQLSIFKLNNLFKKIKVHKFTNKIKHLQVSNNPKLIYLWECRGSFQLFQIIQMKQIWEQKFEQSKIQSLREGQQNKLIIYVKNQNSSQIVLQNYRKKIVQVIDLRFQDYSYPFDLLLTRNNVNQNAEIFNFKTKQKAIIMTQIHSLKTYRFINKQQQISFQDHVEMKLEIFDIILPEIQLKLVCSMLQQDIYADQILLKIENDFIYLRKGQEILIVDTKNMIVMQTTTKPIPKIDNETHILVPSSKQIITYSVKYGIIIQRLHQ